MVENCHVAIRDGKYCKSPEKMIPPTTDISWNENPVRQGVEEIIMTFYFHRSGNKNTH